MFRTLAASRLLHRSSIAPRVRSRAMSGFSSLTPRSLDDIVKRDLLVEESVDRLKQIWLQYHDSSNSAVGFTIDASAQSLITERMKECPMCIWPVFKSGDDHFILLSQLQDTFVLCTYLEEFKRDPATASPWLTLAVYDEFCQDKEVALVRGDFTPNLTKAEGDLTSRLILHAYHDDAAFEYIRTFSQNPAEFDYAKYLEFFKGVHGDLVEDAEARAAAALAGTSSVS